MRLFRVDSWLDAVKHVAIIGGIGTAAVLFFFYVYLPVSTNHGDTITVPNVVGMNYEELDGFLSKRNLRFEVTEDSSYSPNHPPLAVLQQVPLPNSKVKENRKIYLSLNSSSPPLVRMPDLTKGSLKNALMVLKTYDLKLGRREYVADLALNAVLKQSINGKEIKAGDHIPKGSTIDLMLGDGLGNQELEAPDLIGLDGEDAQLAITGVALEIGDVKYDTINIAVIIQEDENGEETEREVEVDPGEVYRQRPRAGSPMKIMQSVDIWVYRPDSISTRSSILDQ